MEELPLDDAPELSLSHSTFYYGMRLLPWSGTRRLVSATLARLIRGVRGSIDAPATPEAKAAVEALRREGLAKVAPALSADQLSQVLGFLREKELVGRDGRRFYADAAPKDARLASYPFKTVLQCPHIAELMNRPEFLHIASAYLGCIPTISGLRIDWSGPAEGPIHVQRFHRDYDDWRFLKLFIYLTDIDDHAGPHEYVRSSHLRSGRFRIRPYEPAQLEREYGAESLVKVKGSVGTSFIADTFGIHRGGVPSAGSRLLLQIQYSLLPVLKFAYRPLEMPLAPHLNPYINRLMFAPGAKEAGLAPAPEGVQG